MIYPVKKVHITQKWGVNEETYKRFGFKGHNGTDFRLFDSAGVRSSNALVYAPHDGVVKERRFDADGYGNYLKIESGIEGSILAHLKEFKVELGATVKEGDLIGIADNTGWSTGSHLHWGYYKHPRNKQNGYGGTIDPLPLISKKENMPETNGLMQIEKKDFEKLVKNSNTLDYLCDKLSFPRNSGGQTIIKRMSEINDNLATEKVAKHDQYNREKIAEVLGVGAGETFEDLVLMIKELKDQPKQPQVPVSVVEPVLPESNSKKWMHSKTIWFNLVMTFINSAGFVLSMASQLPEAIVMYAVMIQGFGNIVLRTWFTDTKLTE